MKKFVESRMKNFEKEVEGLSGSVLLSYSVENFGVEVKNREGMVYSPKSKKSILKTLREIAQSYFESEAKSMEPLPEPMTDEVLKEKTPPCTGHAVEQEREVMHTPYTTEELSKMQCKEEQSPLLGREAVLVNIDYCAMTKKHENKIVKVIEHKVSEDFCKVETRDGFKIDVATKSLDFDLKKYDEPVKVASKPKTLPETTLYYTSKKDLVKQVKNLTGKTIAKCLLFKPYRKLEYLANKALYASGRHVLVNLERIK